MKAMVEAGKTDPAIQARVDVFRHRVPQEFYDLENDPGCKKNLLDSPDHQQLAREFQGRRRWRWMVETNDHCLAAFDARNDPQALAAEMGRYPKLIKPKLNKNSKKPKRPNDEERAAKRRAKRQAAKEKQQ